MGTEQEEGKRGRTEGESESRDKSKARSWYVEKRVLGKVGFDDEMGVGTDVEVEGKARTQAEPLSLRLALSGSNICNPIIWETKARGLNL